MKKLLLLITCCAMIVSCSKVYDDASIWNKVNELDGRVSELERLCQEMNTNIGSLQTLVSAMQSGDYITSITPISRDGAEVGYTITFRNSPSITIYHGEKGADGEDGKDGINGTNGKDGSTPVIGVAKHTDGNYYWTLNEDWLTNTQGNKIKAEGKDGTNGSDGEDGTDGQDGKDGVAPKLKIENGYWYVSIDNGTTWTNIGLATSSNGDSSFQNVINGDNTVTFILTSGETIVVAKTGVGEINFDNPRSFAPGEVKKIPYVLSNNASITVIGVPQEWNILIDKDNSRLVITAPAFVPTANRVDAALLVSANGRSAGVYPITLIVNAVDDGVVISGTVWAKCNLDDRYTFAATPGTFGKYYQYNSSVAIAPTGILPTHNISVNEWSEANDPCPDGWRIPTTAELDALMASGWRKVDPSADNWNVHGIWFGPDATTATSSDMGTSIFLPAANYKYDNNDFSNYFLKTVNYWSRSAYKYSDKYVMAMWNSTYWTGDANGFELVVSIIDRVSHGDYAYSIRCVSK